MVIHEFKDDSSITLSKMKTHFHNSILDYNSKLLNTPLPIFTTQDADSCFIFLGPPFVLLFFVFGVFFGLLVLFFPSSNIDFCNSAKKIGKKEMYF